MSYLGTFAAILLFGIIGLVLKRADARSRSVRGAESSDREKLDELLERVRALEAKLESRSAGNLR